MSRFLVDWDTGVPYGCVAADDQEQALQRASAEVLADTGTVVPCRAFKVRLQLRPSESEPPAYRWSLWRRHDRL